MSARVSKKPSRDLWQERVSKVRAARDDRDRAAGIPLTEALTAEEIEELRAGVIGGLERFERKPRVRKPSWIMRKLFGL